MSVSDGDFAALLARIEAIEARQREAKQHDPDCPMGKYSKAQAQTGAYLIPDNGHWDCNCWLGLPRMKRVTFY